MKERSSPPTWCHNSWLQCSLVTIQCPESWTLPDKTIYSSWNWGHLTEEGHMKKELHIILLQHSTSNHILTTSPAWCKLPCSMVATNLLSNGQNGHPAMRTNNFYQPNRQYRGCGAHQQQAWPNNCCPLSGIGAALTYIFSISGIF